MKIIIGKYEATIYPENGGWTGAISLGFGPDGKRTRIKRKGKTKTAVKEKLVKAVADLDSRHQDGGGLHRRGRRQRLALERAQGP